MFKKRYYTKVWVSVGFVVNLSQMVEYNLANILALNEILSAFDKQDSMYSFEYSELSNKTERWYEWLSKKELGKQLEEIKNKEIFNDEFIKEIDHVRGERNYFVHHIFKDDLVSKEFQDNPKQYVPRLQDLVKKMKSVNDELIQIFNAMQKEVKMIY